MKALLLPSERVRTGIPLHVVRDSNREANTAGFLKANKESLKTGAENRSAPDSNNRIHFIQALRQILGKPHIHPCVQLLIHRETVFTS